MLEVVDHSINPHKVALAVEADGVDAVLEALRDHHSSTDMNQMAFVTLDSFVRCSATTRPGQLRLCGTTA